MKKIRFLAALLVILMLPLSVLFGCNKPDDEDPDDDPSEENGGEQGGGNKPSGGGNSGDVSNVPADNDGLSGNGYLVMFNFNAAKRGNLKVENAPYKRFFTVDAGKTGTVYAVDDKAGKSGTGALLMQRTDSLAQSNFSFTTTALGSTFASQHTLEFDIKLGKGLLGDTLQVVADKKADQVLVSFAPDGKITDCDGMVLYEANKLEGEWVHIALAVDDRACQYAVYINGVKKASDVAFSNKAYSPDEDLERYTFKLLGETPDNTYCYIDNLAFVDGLIPKEHTSDDVIHRDYYTQYFDVFTASKVDKATGNILPNVEALLATYNGTDNALTKVNSDPYNSNSLLSMDEMLTIAKVDSTGAIVEDVYTDFGVLKGLYEYGAPVGGKLYVSGEGDTAKYIDFNSNKGLTFVAKNLLGDGASVNGVYEVYGNENSTKIKLTFGTNLDQVLYCQINSGVLSTYSDETFQNQTATGYECVSQPFNKVEYSYSDDTLTLSVLVNEFTGKASLVIKDGALDLDIDVDDATFTYDADAKLLTVAVGDDSYVFTYNEETVTEGSEDSGDIVTPATFSYTVGENDVKTLTKAVAEEYISAEEAEEYEYVLKYTNFATGVPNLIFTVDLEGFRTDRWNRFRFEYYITEEMASSTYQFLPYVDTGTYADKGGWTYLSKVVKHTVPGWYTLDLSFSELDANRNGEWEDFSGKINIAMSGWSNGTASNPKVASDGYTLLIRNVQFVSEAAVVVDGPDAPAEGEEVCEHVDQDGNSLFVPLEGRIEPTCTVGGYALVKCSVCNATKIDKNKPITEPNGHDYTEAVEFTKNPTCTAGGYTYHYCDVCGVMEKLEELPELGHTIVDNYIPSKNSIVSTCQVCGYETELQLSNELLSFPDKIKNGGLAKADYFYIAEDSEYVSFNEGDFTVEATGPKRDIVQFMCKYTKATAERISDGLYGLKFERKAGTSSDAYIDFLLNQQKFGAGASFVCEFDFMLGGADASGNYPKMSSNIIERITVADGGPTSTQLFSINEKGVLSFANDPNATITFSADKFTNVALVFKPVKNEIDVYVDGYREYTIPFGVTVPTAAAETYGFVEDYIAAMDWAQLRITYPGKTVSNEGQYQYFNNFAAYAGEYPICVRSLGGSSSGGDSEYQGDRIPLKDENGENATYPLVVDADKVLKLADDINVAKYTLEFKLSAEAALADGTLLAGQKRDKHKMDDNVLALLKVKKGWLYFGDTVITALTNITDGITVKIMFNDADGGANVYVNGTEVLGGFIYYPAATGVGDMYNDPESRIRSFTFDSEVGAYTISDLTLRVTK